MLVVAVTGGIASGKSTVARRLADHGAVHVDADALARLAVAPGSPGLAAVEERFAGVTAADGSLDRAALARIVFADEGERRALEAITHPEVWRLARERFDAAGAEDPDAVVVYDVPLLAEARGSRPLSFDRVVAVVAPRDERVRRLVAERGMTAEDALRRIEAQAGDDERIALADEVLDASGGLTETLDAADALWRRLCSAARG